jgi:CheY-like chemotaxis protein
MARQVLLVDADAGYGRALAALLRRQGDHVRVVRTGAAALSAARRRRFDLAVVDLFLGGGGAEVARALSRHVPELVLSLGTRLSDDALLEAALGFPVRRKMHLPAALDARGALTAPSVSSSDAACGATRPGSRRRARAASAPVPAPRAPAPVRVRRVG